MGSCLPMRVLVETVAGVAKSASGKKLTPSPRTVVGDRRKTSECEIIGDMEQGTFGEATEVIGGRSGVARTAPVCEINVTNWTNFEVPWYLIRKMESNGQSGLLCGMSYYSVQRLFGPFSFLGSHLNGIVDVIVVAIGRISPNAETG